MGKTITEKIFKIHCEGRDVFPGDIVFPKIDLAVTHDMRISVFAEQLKEIGISKLKNPENVALVIDHDVHATNVTTANRLIRSRMLVNEMGLGIFYNSGCGIAPNLLIDEGIIRPGMMIISMDPHCYNYGAVGAWSTGILFEFPIVLATGTIWLKVPQTIKVNLTGSLGKGVLSRDVAQWVIKQIGWERGDYRVIEYHGEWVEGLDIEDRMIICNVALEIGAKSAIINPDEKVVNYIQKRTGIPYDIVKSDEDAEYETILDYNVSDLVPQVALPPTPDNIKNVNEISGIKINQAYLGSCASGTLNELKIAADILSGQKINSNVRMIIVPSTQRTFMQASELGIIKILIEAGAYILSPTCGPCFGNLAALGDDEVCICSSTRNDLGRMGSLKSHVYLASAATVAASAIKGEIADPREFLL